MLMVWGDWKSANAAVNNALTHYPWSGHLRQLAERIETQANAARAE
jgi:hypothetical protein